MASRGLIYLPDDAPWVEDYIAELAMFTGDKKQDSYTDQVNVTAYACMDMAKSAGGSPYELPTVFKEHLRTRY